LNNIPATKGHTKASPLPLYTKSNKRKGESKRSGKQKQVTTPPVEKKNNNINIFTCTL
jgi:hypothetical protein